MSFIDLADNVEFLIQVVAEPEGVFRFYLFLLWFENCSDFARRLKEQLPILSSEGNKNFINVSEQFGIGLFDENILMLMSELLFQE